MYTTWYIHHPGMYTLSHPGYAHPVTPWVCTPLSLGYSRLFLLFLSFLLKTVNSVFSTFLFFSSNPSNPRYSRSEINTGGERQMQNPPGLYGVLSRNGAEKGANGSRK